MHLREVPISDSGTNRDLVEPVLRAVGLIGTRRPQATPAWRRLSLGLFTVLFYLVTVASILTLLSYLLTAVIDPPYGAASSRNDLILTALQLVATAAVAFALARLARALALTPSERNLRNLRRQAVKELAQATSWIVAAGVTHPHEDGIRIRVTGSFQGEDHELLALIRHIEPRLDDLEHEIRVSTG